MTENIHKHRILILDFGSQYTQLVARRVRELGVYCELWAWDVTEAQIRDFNPSGIILSGGPESRKARSLAEKLSSNNIMGMKSRFLVPIVWRKIPSLSRWV